MGTYLTPGIVQKIVEAYEDHLKWLRIEDNSLKKAEAKGKAEGKIEVAIALLAKGLDINLISEITQVCLCSKSMN